jgi:hypothetical protein
MVDAYARLIIEPNEEHDGFGSRAPFRSTTFATTSSFARMAAEAAAAGHGEPWVDIVMFWVRSSAGLSVRLPIY